MRKSARLIATLLAPLLLAGVVAAQQADPYTEGMRAFGQDKHREAIGHFEAALERRPGFPPYLYMLAMSLLRAGDRNAAVERFAEAVTDPGMESALREKAYTNMLRALLELENWEAVETRGAEARSAVPDSAEILNQIGRARLARGEFEGAIDILRAASERDSENWTVYNNLGLAYLRQGNFRGAELAFARAVQLAPRVPFVLNNLGAALEAQRRYADAAEAYRRVLEVDPGYSKAQQSLRRMQRMQARSEKQRYVWEEQP